MNTTSLLLSSQARRAARPGRSAAVAAIAVGALSCSMLLAGCGQNFHQDGGSVPVPRATIVDGPPATPFGNPNAVPAPTDGYAPPRTAGPTQTAAPNLPGGKL
ncbi:hypothetical protein BL253_10120 [Pseudofrankia asymbiotica]|uniref:Lipoprotein n=1 Tax=Pseudofrankia asymbiotica TaxID=1834516 RepID=A0A1V2IDX2_9ACTN|nr:hypothetical protein BL253_10120 [Pseudofrankia asymbiotica]